MLAYKIRGFVFFNNFSIDMSIIALKKYKLLIQVRSRNIKRLRIERIPFEKHIQAFRESIADVSKIVWRYSVSIQMFLLKKHFNLHMKAYWLSVFLLGIKRKCIEILLYLITELKKIWEIRVRLLLITRLNFRTVSGVMALFRRSVFLYLSFPRLAFE